MYKFRCELRGHTSDVRCVVHYDEEVIISGSRDRTARVWTATNGVFESGPILCGHNDFIASLCILPSSEMYPDGLIVTGSNDHSICAYTPKCPDVLFKLSSHTDTVCCVSPAVSGVCGLLSSSWDSTAIMWDLMTKSVVFKLPGHKTSILAVLQLECGVIVTASADKILRTFSNTGEFIKCYYGHSDCVRALYPVSKNGFLSCGNDGHVLKWNLDKTSCEAAVDTVHHFLYCVSFSAVRNVIAYCGERGGIYVNCGGSSQVITVPCTTVWSVTVLPDGDIVAGCSDGIIRIYSSDPSRFADDFQLRAYQKEVQRFACGQYEEAKIDVAHPFLNDLSGPEVLKHAGEMTNEICFVRSGFLAVMYSWSTDRWVPLAKRKGTYQYDITKKKIHLGKAYDYLFPINVDDSKPNLIFPFSLGDNIMQKIIEFMAENSLANHYGETIYNHVTNAVKDDFLKSSVLECSMLGLTDDDFVASINKFFPKSKFVCFEKANLDQILGKLKELANKHNLEISDEKREILIKLTKPHSNCTAEESRLLVSFLSWPHDTMLPVLDLLRLAVRNKSFQEEIFNQNEETVKVMTALKEHTLGESLVNRLMALKVCTNMFSHEKGRNIILSESATVLDILSSMNFPKDFSPSLQVAAISVTLNITITTEMVPKLRDPCLNCALTLLKKFTDNEAAFRALITIGNLVSYEGSFLMPKDTVEYLKGLHMEDKYRGSLAHDCLTDLIKCFQDDSK